MTTEQQQEQNVSKLIPVLREGVGLVQMVFYKEVRTSLERKKLEIDAGLLPMMAGTITNEIFGTPNPEPRFVQFRQQYGGLIEQEMLSLQYELTEIRPILTDALRVQTLCDSQEGNDSSATLLRAKDLGLLLEDRDVPLPSNFMTLVRELGKMFNLIQPQPQPQPTADGDADSAIH